MGKAIAKETLDPLGLAFVVAVCFHAFLILGITFKYLPEPKIEQNRQSLEVVVIRQPKPTEKTEEEPELLAQVSQLGAGTTEIKERPKTKALAQPAINTDPRPSAASQQASRPAPPEKQTKPTLTQKKAPRKTSPPKPDATPQTRISTSQILDSRNKEIARLTAELERYSSAYAKRPRRRAISASTTEYKYAAYLEAWRRKVENIGNLNYPDEAKRNKLYGNLVLHVAVRADGGVERIRLLHSSGHKLLDDAAARIVRLAAPFAPFPKEIREETDILDITRTWQFLSSNRLGWKN